MSYEMRKPTKDVCAEQNVTTLILIISSPDNFYARDQIRKTWMYSGVAFEFCFKIFKRLRTILLDIMLSL